MFLKVVLSTFLCCFVCYGSQKSAYKTDPIEITDKSINEKDQETSVILSSSYFKSKGSPSYLSQALNQQTSLEIKKQGGPGSPQSIGFYGLKGKHTLLFLNNIPLNLPGQGIGAGLLSMPYPSISKVTIEKGAKGALYGAHALGGALRLQTDSSPSVHLEGGSFGHRLLQACYAKKAPKGTGALHFSHAHSGGITSAMKERQYGEKMPYDAYNFFTNGTYEINPTSEVSGFAFGAKQLTHYDLIGNLLPGQSRGENKSKNYGMGLSFSQSSLSLPLEHKVTTVLHQESVNTSDILNGRSKEKSELADLGYEATYLFDNKQSLTFKQDNKLSKLKIPSFSKQISTHAGALVYKNSYFKKTNFLAAARYYYHPSFGDKVLLNAEAEHTFPILKGFISFGTGFAPPSLQQLYAETPYTQPNRNLKPEQNTSVSVGIKKQIDRNMFTISTFINLVKNLIGYTFSGTKFTWENRDKFKTYGAEVSYVYRNGPFKNQLSYTFTLLGTNSETLQDRPAKHKVANISTYSWNENFQTHLQVTVISSRHSEGSSLKSYSLIDMSMTYLIEKNRFLFLRAENLLNKRYETFGRGSLQRGFATPSRAFYGGLKWGF